MFNCVKKDDIDYSPYDDGEWRLKLWLFVAYVVSFVSLAASVGLLIQDSLVKSGPSVWTGTAGVLHNINPANLAPRLGNLEVGTTSKATPTPRACINSTGT
ncbi:hypothetical protein Gotri_005318 [Gossypium trilobum]|uniref:Uncharacterized protein n=1 Tax=Gossypium trilobum TaxID=34281 RepID=A0A7J9EXU8_9ROSI|nr:hypothetical protein [Gossypium trilobum]